MPPKPLFDLNSIDTDTLVADKQAIYEILAHRYEFQQLDGIYLCDPEGNRIVGYRDVRDDEFWVRGHIPGRPIFPGVLMIETAAQLVSYFTGIVDMRDRFLGFGGVDGVKFRGTVVPGQRILMLGRMVEVRRRRCSGQTQAYVDGRLVFEGKITGVWL